MVYTSLGTYIQASMLNEELLQREKKMNTKLSEIVTERTQKLLQANRELYRLSNMDTLTNLYNRRYFSTNWRSASVRCARTNGSPCFSSTWTALRSSTTPTGTIWVTRG